MTKVIKSILEIEEDEYLGIDVMSDGILRYRSDIGDGIYRSTIWYLKNVYEDKKSDRHVYVEVDNSLYYLSIPSSCGFLAVLCAARDLKFTGTIRVIHKKTVNRIISATRYWFVDGKPYTYRYFDKTNINWIYYEGNLQFRRPIVPESINNIIQNRWDIKDWINAFWDKSKPIKKHTMRDFLIKHPDIKMAYEMNNMDSYYFY